MNRKKIDLGKAREIVARFNEIPSPIVTARQFVIMHFDELRQSGKSLDALHHFLLANGIDVGPFESFRTVYNSVKRARKNNLAASASSKQVSEPEQAVPVKTNPVEPAPPAKNPEPEKATPAKVGRPQDEEVGKNPKRLPYGKRPILLPDGTEVEIDPETGAKVFNV